MLQETLSEYGVPSGSPTGCRGKSPLLHRYLSLLHEPFVPAMWSYQVPQHSVTSERLAWWCRAKLQMEPGISPELAPAKESEVPSFVKKYGKVTILEWLSYKCISTIYLHIRWCRCNKLYIYTLEIQPRMLHLQAAHLKRQGTAPSFASLIVKKAHWLGWWRTGNKDLAVKIVIYPAKMVDLTWFNHQMLIKHWDFNHEKLSFHK